MPDPLKDLLAARPLMTLEEFVETSNELLPHYLPEDPANTRVKHEVNIRLIRHYTSEGLLAPPLKQGREARYQARHLLQLLVVRKLLARGLAAGAIDDLARKKSDAELIELLEGGVRVEISSQLAADNEALAFLEQIRRRDGPRAPRKAARASPPPASAPAPSPSETRWDRYPLKDGLELHVRSDITLPASRKERQNLIDHLTRTLLAIRQRRKQ